MNNKWRRTGAPLTRALLAAGLVAAGLVAAGTPAQAAPKETYQVIPYLITDPGLAKQTDRIAAELGRSGNLDRLGVRPAAGGKPSAIAGKAATRAAEPVFYQLDSSLFPRGTKPADPYRYTNLTECQANADRATPDAGWIKNRYSYCQTHTIAAVAVLCVLGRCRVTGIFVSTNTLIGHGKIGAYPGTTGWRWADFVLNVNVTTATGPFNTAGASMEAEIECEGHWDTGGPDADREACHGGDNDDVRKRIASWVVDPNGVLDLVSEARDPDAARGEQIATGVFHVDYDFDLPFPYIFGASASGPEGGMRFDSAWYVAQAGADKLGSVFDRAVPGFGYSLSDAPVRGVAQHLLQAQADPGSTLPTRTDKVLAGALPSDPLHRLAPGKGQYQTERGDENERVRTNYCNTVAFRDTMPTNGLSYDCDEYPMRSTYEGAGRSAPQYDGSAYVDMYSVQWVVSDENQEAGRRLGRWYENDRILDEDAFFVPITITPPGGPV